MAKASQFHVDNVVPPVEPTDPKVKELIVKQVNAKMAENLENNPNTIHPATVNDRMLPTKVEKTVIKQKQSLYAKIKASLNSTEVVDANIYYIAYSSFFIGLSVGVIIPTLPKFAANIGLTPIQFGTIVSATNISRAVFTLPCNWMMERFGTYNVMFQGVFLSSLIMGCTGVAFDFYSLLLMRALIGVTGTMYNLGSSVYVNKITSIFNRQNANWYVNTSFAMGFLFGPLLGGMIVQKYGYFYLFVGIGISQMFGTAMIYKFVNELGDKNKDFNFDYKKLFLKDISKFKTITHSDEPQDKTMKTLIYNYGITTGIYFGSIFTLFPVTFTQMGMTPVEISYIVTSYMIVQNLISKITGKYSDKYGRRSVCIIGNSMYALGFILFGFGNNYAYVGSLIAFAFAQSMFAPMNAWMIDMTKDGADIRFTNTFAKISQDLGCASAALFLAYSLEIIGSGYTCGIISSINLICTYYMRKNTKDNKKFEE